MVRSYRKAFYDYLADEFGHEFISMRWKWNVIRQWWPVDEDSALSLSEMLKGW